ncbi:ATP-dependent DNA helicase [Sinomicrobium soli]|uniref:ATP-dependent DNA helicase n=1 Tax=Sinomicrobium sp. N-1-3-6 TaxID=2219864 RepID=UPI000DCD2DBC|nr:AAA family ATPase [Sinomicrobium sp. N-1-3-6]RAV30370.1 ATP-dependent endonuclease [Sinomicrobium sp. N-1-3-6]
MDVSSFYKDLVSKFPHTPTSKQEEALQQLSGYVFSTGEDRVFVLKGFAGTGKTTIIGALVGQMKGSYKKTVLLAPTGRAAKVITSYAGTRAFTIHKKIYFPKKGKGGAMKFVLQPNKHRDTLFIVDEASMIPDLPGDSRLFENGSLLDDLMYYVYSGHNCKLMLIGDTAQLPPVNLDISPALDENTLGLHYNKEVGMIELDEVVRQQLHSGILYNATGIRECLGDDGIFDFKFELGGFDDIVRLTDGYDIQSAIDEAYGNRGQEETVIIVRSNKRANLYNQQIRSRILFHDNELTAGDLLMVVKNNYFWVKTSSEAGFIANGDIVEVLEIFAIKELYGFKFAEVKVRMIDYPDMSPLETVLLLDTIHAETPSLSYEDSNRLYQEVMKDYEEERSGYKKFLKVKNNKYFNALQVKFSYAITCHKSQGGQWDTVFVEQPYLPDGIDRDYLRWLYTAVTRARHKLYLIGFKDDFFVGE